MSMGDTRIMTLILGKNRHLFNKLTFHLIFIAKYIIWQKQKTCHPKEKILCKTTQATTTGLKLDPTAPLQTQCRPHPEARFWHSDSRQKKEYLGKEVFLSLPSAGLCLHNNKGREERSRGRTQMTRIRMFTYVWTSQTAHQTFKSLM